ncbi:hypothetical protein F5B19DRAFT_498246 [Rostrohypoxylon terebratum]|nr:hypothetical protein F5B19DRAFT_498246 [Rostrohypoxylon terebratum]
MENHGFRNLYNELEPSPFVSGMSQRIETTQFETPPDYGSMQLESPSAYLYPPQLPLGQPTTGNFNPDLSSLDNAPVTHSEPDDPFTNARQSKNTVHTQDNGSSLWACPFAKMDPMSYSSCNRYNLKDITRVKQHLDRVHERPHFCPVCWTKFRLEEEYQYHIRERKCSVRPEVAIEGVTSEQKKLLKCRSDTRLSKREQWYAIYRILFPDKPQPTSPYAGSGLSGELLSVYKFAKTEGHGIMERKALQDLPWTLIPQQNEVFNFVGHLYREVIEEVFQSYNRARF